MPAHDKHRRPAYAGWIARAASGLGAIGLLAATAATPALLTRLSPDGQLSPGFLEQVRLLRLGLGGFSSLLVIGGCRQWGGRWAGLLAAVGCAGWLAVLLNAMYPQNLFGRPGHLFQAAVGEELLLRDYAPKPRLVVPAHEVLRARYPVINIHAHFRHWVPHYSAEQITAIMAACNVERVVDLDGFLGEELREEIAQYAQRAPDRLIVFATFNFPKSRMTWDRFQEKVAQLDEAKRAGAQGIKIWKNLGLKTRDEQNRLIAVDDPRLDPLWNKAGELHLPILIHVGDPVAFFDPICAQNERFEELKAFPSWSFYGPEYPPLAEVIRQFERMVARHPDVTFIFAHLGNRTDDLREAAGLLDRHPNLLMDISARVSELGRQPRATRDFLIRYQDRLLFGTDGNADAATYRTYFRFLETADEYFDYPFWPRFNYGRWKIYGINLPDEVLRKLYHDNAAKVLGLPPLAAGTRER